MGIKIQANIQSLNISGTRQVQNVTFISYKSDVQKTRDY